MTNQTVPCATKAYSLEKGESHAIQMMAVGPPEPPYRWRLQTAPRCCSQKAMVLSVGEKAAVRAVRYAPQRRMAI